eukprot:CAMPEP_0194754542 /NCGR_PEP_ID=MMETSP0323_2-20130528/8496_1 /TAXON_ID=2866 ORGANISM="Crypthecodinium cohnii, Strain Seligo" /NCGR_SAMPLE_ID=MMETSP0323_2 /ASSEMBLY_ACC=CAM_ASM_000346 /LENGTH=61 /DNA_ID=CAMNT_0039673131 /DNA_START=8 /DNA_END=193 /DNA_ORIENTATION=-
MGNKCVKATISLANAALHYRVAGTIENPATSRLFLLDSVSKFSQRTEVYSITFDFCAYGEP